MTLPLLLPTLVIVLGIVTKTPYFRKNCIIFATPERQVSIMYT